jgi:manganese/zinc/iron transport system substrate-binding protein
LGKSLIVLRRLWILGGLVATLSGCGASLTADRQRGAGDAEVEAVATVGMVADLVRNVAGPHVGLTQLMGPGVDPHLYKVTRDDVRAIFAGDVVFYSGLMLEGKMTHTLRQMSQRKPVIGVAESLPPSRMIGSDDSPTHAVANDHPDPHVWMDVAMWADCLPAVVEALSALAPQHRRDFESNAARYHADLIALHQYGIDVIATIPASRRQLITSHDAFGYFGRAYGLAVTGVQGLSTDS